MRKEHLSAYALRNYVAKKTKGKPRGPKPKGASTMVQLIKQVASRTALAEMETKFICEKQNAIAFNSQISTGTSEMYSLIPQLAAPATGVAAGDWQRMNNDVTPMSCRTDWTFSLNAESTRSVNILAVLYCLQSKSTRYFPDLIYEVGSAGPTILRSGTSAQVQQFNGYPSDIALPINTEEFTLLHKKVFHLQKNVGSANSDTTSGSTPNSAPSVFRHSYSVKCPKQYKYSPSGLSEVYPQGHAPFWVLGYCHVDGSAPDVLNTDLVASWNTSMTFKDA